MPTNEALQVLNSVRENPGFDTLQDAIKRALEACVISGSFTKRVREQLIPLVRKAEKHFKCVESDRIRFHEVRTQIKTGAAPATVLATYNMNSDRVAAAKVLETIVAIPAGDREDWPHDKPVVASNTGLLDQARKIAEERQENLGTDHLLAAMDQRFPYATPAKASRDLSELRDEFAVYMEYDAIMVEWQPEETCPFRLAAEHRIKMDKLVPDGIEPLWYRQIRWRITYDSFFLARAVLGFKFVNAVHRELTDGFFVLKNPLLSVAEQSPIKDRLLLFPRGSFKSTANVVDCLSWLVGFPDIRILILTATRRLSKLFLQQIKSAFVSNSGEPETSFQRLYPEYVMKSSQDGTADAYNHINHASQKREPNCFCSSLESRLPGWHCDIQVLDDVCDDLNTATEDQIEKTNTAIDLADSLRDPGGYRVVLGTPYAREDFYAQLQKRAGGNAEHLKVLVRPARTVKPEKASVPAEQLKPDDYNYLFGVRLSPKFLADKERNNRRTFASQYMLRFVHESDVTFPIDLLLKAVVPFNSIPTSKVVYYVAWDFAYSQAGSRLSDYSVGIVACVDEQSNTYVVDMMRDRYSPADLAREVVASYSRYHPTLVSVEGSNGAQNLSPAISNIAVEMGIVEPIPLNFISLSTKRGAKASRISVLEPALRQGLLHFSSELPDLDELIKEFEAYPGGRHDDILDACAYLYDAKLVPSLRPVRDPDEIRRLQQDLISRDLEQRMFPEQNLPQEMPIGPGSGTGEDAPDPPWNPYETVGFGGPVPAGRR